MTVQIPLTQGQFAIVDDIDADLADAKWHATKGASNHSFYAVRKITDPNTKRRSLKHMHRVILERVVGRSLCGDELADHIDGNGLNNCRENLRVASRTENVRNQRKSVKNSSGFKGVSWNEQHQKWRALIRVNGRLKHLGLFDTPEAAHEAYCKAAASPEFHGEFANFGTAQS